MTDKNFLGKGWIKTFQNGGSIINLSLTLEELNKLPVDNYGCIKVEVHQRKEQDPKSKATHYVVETTYKKPEQGHPHGEDVTNSTFREDVEF